MSMSSREFMKKAVRLVACDTEDLDQNIHIVWYAWVLGSQKALLTTPGNDDGLYFEVTYNRDKDEFYLDRYKKESNKAIKNWEV